MIIHSTLNFMVKVVVSIKINVVLCKYAVAF